MASVCRDHQYAIDNQAPVLSTSYVISVFNDALLQQDQAHGLVP